MDKQVDTRVSGLTRRELLKSGLLVGGGLVAGGVLVDSASFRTARAHATPIDPHGSTYIEVFPTSPLILNPFTDELPIPLPLKPVPKYADDGSGYAQWGTPPNPQSGGVQDSRGYTHQLGCAALGLPAPTYYRIPLQVGAHSFSSSKVLPIDSGGKAVDNTMPGYEFLPWYDPQTGLGLPPSTIYGFNGAFPGALIKAYYGQPVCVRFVNELDQNPYGFDRNDFGQETFLTHLHNGHTATECDGNPNWLPHPYHHGEWCDNLYLNWCPDGDRREMQSTLWFHDHTHGHTGANVYKGMVGLYPIYDPQQDNGNEKKGYRLPGVTDATTGEVKYDIPLAFYDCCLDDGVTQHKDFHNGTGETHPEWWGQTFFRHFPNHGFVGDVFTVNCKANPVLEVKRRRYRLRLLDASIARLYEVVLMSSTQGPVAAKDTGRSGVKLQGQYQLPDGERCMKMTQIATEGGLLPFPFLRNSIKLAPGKRREVIVDFSKYMDGTPTTKGDVIYLVNVLQMTNGRKPNHAFITHDPDTDQPLPMPIPDPEFDPDFRVPLLKIVIGDDAPDDSLDPLDYVNKDSSGTCTLKLNPTTQLPILGMRALPSLPRSFKGFAGRTFELQRSGTFGGETEWLINGEMFDHHKDLAFPILGAGELWTIRNGGGGWVHPMHFHQEEHRVISRNGVLTPDAKNPLLYNRTYNGHDRPDDIGKEDVIDLDGSEEVVIWRKFRSFRGPYVAHCHNLAHEDHAMMFGWEIV